MCGIIVISHMMLYMISCCAQGIVVVLAPYPNNPNPVESFNVKTDFDLQGNGLVWYAATMRALNSSSTAPSSGNLDHLDILGYPNASVLIHAYPYESGTQGYLLRIT